MKYCSECGSEYQDSVAVCSDCTGSALVSAQALTDRGGPQKRMPVEDREFVCVGEAQDPLTADELGQVLRASLIPVSVRSRQSSSVDVLTAGTTGEWWEFWVPEALRVQAEQLLFQTRANLAATEEDAARAAEEEVEQSLAAQAGKVSAPPASLGRG